MKQLYVNPVSLCLAAVSVWLLGACTSETPDTSHEVKAISFNTPQTRAAIEDPSGMKAFSVWGWYRNTTTGGSPVSVFDNTTVTQSSGWNYEGGTRYWIPGNTYNFYAVHPVGTGSYSPEGVLTVTNFDCSKTGQGAVDLMTAVNEGMKGDNPQSVAMKFGHELTHVSFTIKAEGTPVSLDVFKLVGVYYQGTLSKTAGNSSWSNQTSCNSTDDYFKLASSISIEAGKEVTPLGDLLLIPHTQLADAKLHIGYCLGEGHGSTGSPDYEKEISLQTNDITSWAAGKSYHYVLTIQGNELRINITVNEWKEEDTSINWGDNDSQN